MSDEKFILEYEKLLDKGYCNCNEMNCIDNNSPRRILRIVKSLQQENQELKKQLEEKIILEMKLKDKLEEQRKEYQETYKDVREEIKEYKNRQQKFMEYLEKEIVDSKDGSGQQYFAQQHLRLYKEIIGDKE